MNPLADGFIQRFLGRLRFKQLFLLTVAVFVVDLFVPDFIPFADEILLALLSILFGSLKKSPELESKSETEA